MTRPAFEGDDVAMAATELHTPSLRLVPQTRDEVQAMIEAMPPSEKAQLSADWLALFHSSTAADPWVHGFRLVHRDSGIVVGTCSFKGPPANGIVEIAYGVAADQRRKGYATEAAQALVAYAFTFDEVCVVRAHTLPESHASKRVLVKCGFRHVGEVIDPEDGLVWRFERQQPMPSPSFRLEPLPGYTPTIGRLVGILGYARQTTLAAVEGLSIAELDHLQDDRSNSIGALLAHIAAVERGYQCVTFEERAPSALEQSAWEPALTLGAEGRRLLRNKPLEHYVHELSEARRLTLEGLAARDDAWLEQTLRATPAMNAHFAWFHVAEDEISHRGQIRWLRARLGSSPAKRPNE